jgi:methyl-accepting chemotaxis protein
LQVSSNIQSLATASEGISAASRDQAHGAELQKDQTNQVAAAMQEMAATVQEVSENSNKAAVASQKAAETAREGGQVVEETLSKMRAIATSVGETGKKVQELGKRSDEIGRISGVIEDIADQTNLLALNAAIEAARAGEQGRGFAVVADEVRKLAERTGNATKEIAEMIRSVQAETRTAVAAMEAGSREVESGVESTRRAGDSLQGIIEMSEQVGDMVTQIATAATQQPATTEPINSNIEQIARIASSTEAGVQQTAGAIQDLSALALNLRQVLGQFRLSDGTEGTGRSRSSQVDQAVTNSMDFARVKMAHRSWRLKLRSFLDGRENIDSKGLASHRDCELGKWIYGGGTSAYSRLPEMQELEKKHKDMHALVKHVVKLKHAGKASEAEQEFSRVGDAAEQVVALITKVEAQVMAGSRAVGAGSLGPLSGRTRVMDDRFVERT